MVKNMYSKEYSEVWNLFYAVHVSEISKLETGERIKITPEPYFMIDLPIPENNKNPTLIDCFDHYVEGEILKDDNAWFHDETNERINKHKRQVFDDIKNDPSQKAQLLWTKLKKEYPDLK